MCWVCRLNFLMWARHPCLHPCWTDVVCQLWKDRIGPSLVPGLWSSARGWICPELLGPLSSFRKCRNFELWAKAVEHSTDWAGATELSPREGHRTHKFLGSHLSTCPPEQQPTPPIIACYLTIRRACRETSSHWIAWIVLIRWMWWFSGISLDKSKQSKTFLRYPTRSHSYISSCLVAKFFPSVVVPSLPPQSTSALKGTT